MLLPPRTTTALVRLDRISETVEVDNDDWHSETGPWLSLIGGMDQQDFCKCLSSLAVIPRASEHCSDGTLRGLCEKGSYCLILDSAYT